MTALFISISSLRRVGLALRRNKAIYERFILEPT